MSASKEKKVRADERGAGTSKKRNAADEKAKQEQKMRRGLIIGTVIVAVIAIAAIVWNTGMFGLFYNSLTAVKIGDTSYTAAELDVFYRNTYNNQYSNYSSYASAFGVDAGSLIDTDTVYARTLDDMKQITALYDAAKADGYTLSEEDRATVDDQLASIQTYAAMYGYSTDAYIAALYGRGVTEKTIESVLTRIVTAQSYAQKVQDDMSYPREQLDGYYAEHADEYDAIDYFYYTVSASDDAFADFENEDAKKAAAHDAAAEIAKASDEDGFKAAVAEFKEDAAPGEQYLQGNALSSIYSKWLLDGSRKAGDTTVVDTDSGSTALLFAARDDNDYRLRSMRHMLIESEADENYEYTDEAGEAAKAQIEEIYNEWLEDPTEDHFAELANEYSEDAGSNTTGGLYENIHRRQMVTNINNFLFNETHEPGDTAILFGESGAYQGWHLVYYVGEGPVYKYYLSYVDYLTVPYAVSTGAGLSFANLG